MLGHIARPVVQSRSAHCQPQQDTNHVHDRVGQIALVLRIVCARMCHQLDRGVDQVNDHDTGGEDLRVRTLFLVQVPYPTNAQEFTPKSGAVENDDDNVQDLRAEKCVISFPKNFVGNSESTRHYTLD
jgi:hypothetical protein